MDLFLTVLVDSFENVAPIALAHTLSLEGQKSPEALPMSSRASVFSRIKSFSFTAQHIAMISFAAGLRLSSSLFSKLLDELIEISIDQLRRKFSYLKENYANA